MPKTNVSALLRGILPKKTYSKYNQSTEAGTSFFLECVFFFIFIIDGAKKISDSWGGLLSSSAVEQVTVNHLVAGSIPA